MNPLKSGYGAVHSPSGLFVGGGKVSFLSLFPFSRAHKWDKQINKEEDRGIKGARRHFSHGHELILADTSIHQISGEYCQTCDEQINLTNSTVAAMCYICRLYWHKSCVELPQHIAHPFHPHHTLEQSAPPRSGKITEYDKCNACGRDCTRYAYKCSQTSCAFCLDLSCAALTPSSASPSISIPADRIIVCPLSSFSSGSHRLILCDVNYTTALQSFCSVCGVEFPKQVQEAALYVCLHCRITAHVSCAHQLLPPQISNHPIHSEHTLELYHNQGIKGKFYDHLIDLGSIYYRCSMCTNFNLHPILATTATAIIVDEHNDKNNNSNHNHQITGHIHPVIHVNFHPRQFVRLLCFACKDAIKDDCVTCFCRQCNVFLHKSCATLPRQIQHPCHQQHPLNVYEKGGFVTCMACQCEIEGYSYRCNSCHFYLHSKCAMESIFYPPIKSESHPHPLVYFKSGLKCQVCRLPRNWGPIFGCRELSCNFYIHAHCLPKSELPFQVKNIHHLHILNLTYSRITDSPDDGSEWELYCDSCEERRKPSMPTYYCADCHFVAHVDCNISEVINHFVKNSTLTEELENISFEEKSMVSKELVDIKFGTSKTDGGVQDAYQIIVKDLDTEIAIQSMELGKLKAKLDQLAQEIEEKSAKLDQLEQRRAQLLASLAHL